MPAEWSPHSQTLTVWPDIDSVGDADILNDCRSEVSSISNAIARFEPVTMFTRPQHVAQAKATVSECVTVVGLDASHLWVRDTGPVFVKNPINGRIAGVNLNFNYWGGKLPQVRDKKVASRILSIGGVNIPMFTASFQAEGGAIEVDGEGTLLATESSIINPNRNPGRSKLQLEESLRAALGIEKVLWLPGIKGFEITDFHIDAFARRVRPGVVLLGTSADNAMEVLVKAYREAREILGQAIDAKGRRVCVVEIVEPDIKSIPGRHYGTTFASYVNYLVVNGGVIIPRFGVGKADEDALELFRQVFPSHGVVQVDIKMLPKLGGGIHCATQHVPNRIPLF